MKYIAFYFLVIGFFLTVAARADFGPRAEATPALMIPAGATSS